MSYNYITIEREYGSGGAIIADRLSKDCGIPCYGQQIFEKVSQELRMSVDQIENREEKVTNSFLYSMYMLATMRSGSGDMLTAEKKIFLSAQKAVQDFAAKGNCIFVEHCASEALKDRKDVLRVFIRSDYEHKKQRAISEYGIPEADVDRTMRHYDKRRSSFFYDNTSKRWDSMESYDLILDSGSMGIDSCVQILKSLL